MSKATFAKLIRNIERTGRYEPLVVRPHPGREGFFQVINGHHRLQALKELGHEAADVVVWDIDDAQVQILLATLNRLTGNDVLEKKLELLRKLSERMQSKELARLLPQTASQIERLTNLQIPTRPAPVDSSAFAMPLVFFVNDQQHQVIEQALSAVEQEQGYKTKAQRKAAAITKLAQCYIDQSGRS
jgi:ParB-like chromosome segregation protein Spo0J